MSYTKFNPKKHKQGVKLYEEKVRMVGDVEEFFMAPVDVAWEDVIKTPWYYYVVGE